MHPPDPDPDDLAVAGAQAEPRERCAICGRALWSDGLAPARDGEAWICGDCDQARTFTALDP